MRFDCKEHLPVNIEIILIETAQFNGFSISIINLKRHPLQFLHFSGQGKGGSPC